MRLAAYIIGGAQWRHGCSRDETKYRGFEHFRIVKFVLGSFKNNAIRHFFCLMRQSWSITHNFMTKHHKLGWDIYSRMLTQMCISFLTRLYFYNDVMLTTNPLFEITMSISQSSKPSLWPNKIKMGVDRLNDFTCFRQFPTDKKLKNPWLWIMIHDKDG